MMKVTTGLLIAGAGLFFLLQRYYRIDERQRQGRRSSNRGHQEELLDEGLEESFPASDPPSVSYVD